MKLAGGSAEIVSEVAGGSASGTGIRLHGPFDTFIWGLYILPCAKRVLPGVYQRTDAFAYRLAELTLEAPMRLLEPLTDVIGVLSYLQSGQPYYALLIALTSGIAWDPLQTHGYQALANSIYRAGPTLGELRHRLIMGYFEGAVSVSIALYTLLAIDTAEVSLNTLIVRWMTVLQGIILTLPQANAYKVALTECGGHAPSFYEWHALLGKAARAKQGTDGNLLLWVLLCFTGPMVELLFAPSETVVPLISLCRMAGIVVGWLLPSLLFVQIAALQVWPSAGATPILGRWLQKARRFARAIPRPIAIAIPLGIWAVCCLLAAWRRREEIRWMKMKEGLHFEEVEMTKEKGDDEWVVEDPLLSI